MHTLKLTQIGNSVGAVFPRELLNRLQLDKGDRSFTETARRPAHHQAPTTRVCAANGGRAPDHENRRAVLHELAK